MQELYVKKIDIEAKTLSQLATSHVIPAAVEYQSKLAINVQALKGAGLNKTSYETQLKTIESISKHIKTISDNVDKIISETTVKFGVPKPAEKLYIYIYIYLFCYIQLI